MHRYNIVEANDNPLQTIVEKDGITARFSLHQLIQDEKAMQKNIVEAEGQLLIEDARRVNVEQNHPFVLEVSDEEIERAHHIIFHQQAVKKCDKLKEFLEVYKKGVEDNRAEIEEIKKQTGLTDIVEDEIKND